MPDANPTLTIVFKNVGLIVNKAPSRAYMLQQFHETTLVTPLGKRRALTGQTVTIRTKGGQQLTGKSTPAGKTRLVHLKDALKKNPELRPETEIKPLINAEVVVPVGAWHERDPQFRTAALEKAYKNMIWEFVPDLHSPKQHDQLLTNVAEHTSDLDVNETYGVYVDGTLVEEFSGKQDQALEIVSDDVYPPNHDPYSGVLEDFDYLFALLKPLEKPFPKVKQKTGEIPPGAGWTRPICPKAQMD